MYETIICTIKDLKHRYRDFTHEHTMNILENRKRKIYIKSTTVLEI